MSDDLIKYITAKQEALRFVQRVNDLQKRYDQDAEMRRYMSCGVGYKETAAAKRSSLDLTRALSNLRKP